MMDIINHIGTESGIDDDVYSSTIFAYYANQNEARYRFNKVYDGLKTMKLLTDV